jgi:hypothetical protein
MATLTKFVRDFPAISKEGSTQIVATNKIDFSKPGYAGAASDVVQVLSIPKGAFVRNVFVRVITAEGSTCTAKVGDGSDDDGFDASVDLNAAANTLTAGIAGTDAYVINNIGKLYTSADTIDLTLGHTTANAVIEVMAVYCLFETLLNS